MRITFEPLTRDDFATLARWLADPGVARWWNHRTTPEALEADFGGSVDGTDPVDVVVVGVDGTPAGLIESYRIADHPDDLAALEAVVEVPVGARSIDDLLGDAALRGHGVGPAVIAAFIGTVWDADPEATCVIVPVVAANRASWRALEKVGFAVVAEADLAPDNPIDEPRHLILRIDRPGTLGRSPRPVDGR